MLLACALFYCQLSLFNAIHFSGVSNMPSGQPISAILDPSFQLLGDIQIDLPQVKTTKFRLNGVQFSAPIDGTISVELRCYADGAGSVQHRGFLVCLLLSLVFINRFIEHV
jgi:hypothetical protein